MLEKRSSIAPGRVLLLKGKNLRTCCRRDNSGSLAPPHQLLIPPHDCCRGDPPRSISLRRGTAPSRPPVFAQLSS